ncbi:MAG: HAD hydrolase-like protein [Deltaproteobacteria bacterium]|nr:HAD hydrolase-like protein [Deltaproteobacteria bacterium]
MALRYRCLVIDHDDTVVDSSRVIHHAAHVESMRVLRPGVAPVDLDGWFLKNFEPGISRYLEEELGLGAEELKQEYAIWRRHSTTILPRFYPGVLDVLRDFRAAGGLLAVVSHSESDVIRSHYEAGGAPREAMPNAIYGWESGDGRRKPAPWPIEDLRRRYGLAATDVLVVDDLKPGIDMAEAAGVPAAAAGWAHRLAPIERFMREHCVAYFETVGAFGEFVLGTG